MQYVQCSQNGNLRQFYGKSTALTVTQRSARSGLTVRFELLCFVPITCRYCDDAFHYFVLCKRRSACFKFGELLLRFGMASDFFSVDFVPLSIFGLAKYRIFCCGSCFAHCPTPFFGSLYYGRQFPAIFTLWTVVLFHALRTVRLRKYNFQAKKILYFLALLVLLRLL